MNPLDGQLPRQIDSSRFCGASLVKDTIYDSLSDDQLTKVDKICTDFELAYGEDHADSIEAVVARHSPDVPPVLEIELVAAEVQLRLGQGESFTAESYVERFPRWGHEIRCLFAETGETLGFAWGDTHQERDLDSDMKLPREFGQYRLIEQIGQGGMGTVFRAEHLRLQKDVALKLLTPAIMSNEVAVERFQREMCAIGKLDHPNIVRALDAGEIDGVHYLTMEYVDGIDLRKLVLATGPMRYQDACELICQAAKAL